MNDEHLRPHTASADLLRKNYQYLSDLYKRGKFEDLIDESQFTFFRGGDSNLKAAQKPDDAGLRRRSAKLPAPLKLAAEDLNELATHLESSGPHDPAGGLEILILRAKVLNYEIGDYFLDVPKARADYFKGQAREIGEILRGFDPTEAPNHPDPLVTYAAQRYPSIREPEQLRDLVQQLVLVALSGLNQMYRDHRDDSYHQALPLAESLRQYIQHGLPKLSSPERVSSGLLGLTLYILGRLKLGLNLYAAADRDFIASTECYANRVHEKEELFRHDQLTQEQYEATRLLTLRRSALVSAFGSGFLSLLTSDLPAALKSIALARGIVKQNSGLVNSAYTDLLYCAVKRAQHSSDLNVLREIRRILYRCLFIFRAYVPDRHYEHRAGIELALVYHYTAKAEPRRERSSYARALRYLTRAVKFAEERAMRAAPEPQAPAEAGPAGPRSTRLLAEALTIMSHITRHCGHSMENAERAINLASGAVTAAQNSRLYTAEAYVAMGAAHATKAELLKSAGVSPKAELTRARVNFLNALRFNEATNARISALCFIRLGLISLLDKETLAEARYWHDRWMDIKARVHHEFCHQAGRELERAVRKLGGVTYLLIDPDESLNRKDWQESLDNFLSNQVLYRVAKELREQTAAGEEARPSKNKADYKKRLASFIINELGLSQSNAYIWIEKYKLEARLKELFRR